MATNDSRRIKRRVCGNRVCSWIGPYDMSGAQLDMVAAFEPYAVRVLPYVIQSYQRIWRLVR